MVILGSQTYLYALRTESNVDLLSLMPSHHHLEIGQRTGIRLDLQDLQIYRSR